MRRQILTLTCYCILLQYLVVHAESSRFHVLRWLERARRAIPTERTMSYDQRAHQGEAVSALKLDSTLLQWSRLDDGVMGGKSQTIHHADNHGSLHFTGNINTDGGGFASIRSKIPEGLITTSSTAIKIRFRGDGKTYKFLLSNENRNSGNPTTSNPSWQIDLPTQASSDDEDDWQEVVLPFCDFKPTFGGRRQSRPSEEEVAKLQFDPTSMREIGFMLSLYRAGGVPNPTKTFGEGVFPFSLRVQGITVER